MGARAIRKTKNSLKYIWHERSFFVGEGKNRKYYDRGYDNIVDTHFNTLNLRQQILNRLPLITDPISKEFIPEFNKVFCPINYNSDCALFFGADKTVVNHYYAPFSVLSNVIRDYYSDFKNFVNGIIIPDVDTYNSIKDRFNDLYLKLITFKFTAAFALGSCSIDDFVTLGSLFYILQQCCDNSEGLVIDDDCFENQWCGEIKIIEINDKEFDCYKAKLKRVNFCSLSTSNFVNRFKDYSDSDTLWFYEFYTDVYNNNISTSFDNFNPDEIVYELDNFKIKTEETKSKMFSIFYSNTMINDDIIKYTKAVKINDNYYRSYDSNFFIETDVQSSDNGVIKKQTIITDYDTKPFYRRNGNVTTAQISS